MNRRSASTPRPDCLNKRDSCSLECVRHLKTVFFPLFKPVGCDGVVGSGVTTDACGVCGGQGKGCRLYEGIFMEPILPRGHQPVTTVPKGAMSLNISELRFSSNFLGRRSRER